MSLQRLLCIPLLFVGTAAAGINWVSVWLEPRTPVVLTVGETRPYTVMGLSGAHTKADLTKSPHLKMTSSDVDVLEIDREAGKFIARKPGHVEIRIEFSEAVETVPAFVRAPKAASQTNPIEGVWRAVFTGDVGQRPKAPSEIVFDVNANGNLLTGPVHAGSWPGDAVMSDGRIDGDRVTFAMTGQLPSQAGGVIGYPKLCFTGIRHGDEMKINLLWTGAGSPCEDGRQLEMLAKKVAD